MIKSVTSYNNECREKMYFASPNSIVLQIIIFRDIVRSKMIYRRGKMNPVALVPWARRKRSWDTWLIVFNSGVGFAGWPRLFVVARYLHFFSSPVSISLSFTVFFCWMFRLFLVRVIFPLLCFSLHCWRFFFISAGSENCVLLLIGEQKWDRWKMVSVQLFFGRSMVHNGPRWESFSRCCNPFSYFTVLTVNERRERRTLFASHQ